MPTAQPDRYAEDPIGSGPPAEEWTEDDVHRYRLAKAQVMAKKQSDSRL